MKKRKITEQEREEFLLKAIRSVDYPWNLTLEGWHWAIKAEKRVGTKANLEIANQKKQRETTIKYKAIRKFAEQVIAEDPKLRRASPTRLARKIYKLKPDWSARTIRRALTPPK
jgi:hypothetical protein